MNPFEDITIEWSGTPYVISANKVMGAISRIEEVVTLEELGRFHARGTAPLIKLCQAYGTVLRYAGAKVTDEEIYAGIFTDQGKARVLASVSTLMMMMVPPSVRDAPELPADTAEGNAEPASGLSSKRTGRRSGKGG